MQPIVYGMPGPDLFEAAERGEVLLGGCVMYDGQPISRCMTCGAESRRQRPERVSMPASEGPRKRLHRLLKHDLGGAVKKTKRGTWTTTSSLPHEIRLHVEGGMELVRVSAGMVVCAKPSKALLKDLNALNVQRAFSRRIIGDGKVLVVAEMPVASLRKGDLEHLVSMVFCCARLDAPMLAEHGGHPVTDPPPPALAPGFDSELHDWTDVLRASGTATDRELALWLDDLVGCDCWIDRDEDSVTVVIGCTGTVNEYPFRLEDLRQSAVDRQEEYDQELEDED